MSGPILIFPLVVVGVLMISVVIYIIRGKIKQAKEPNAYRWKPEQDYDVVMTGETNMTPGFPTLKKRQDKFPESGEPGKT